MRIIHKDDKRYFDEKRIARLREGTYRALAMLLEGEQTSVDLCLETHIHFVELESLRKDGYVGKQEANYTITPQGRRHFEQVSKQRDYSLLSREQLLNARKALPNGRHPYINIFE